MERNKLEEGRGLVESNVAIYARKIGRMRDDLLAKIAAAYKNREMFPLTRENFKIRIKPLGTRIISTDIIPFSTVERFFVTTFEKMLGEMIRNYPTSSFTVEFWLFPYEIGGRKFMDNVIFYPQQNEVKKDERKPKTAAQPVVETIAEPVTEVLETVVEEIAAAIPEMPAIDITEVENGLEIGVLDTPINYEYSDWRLYRTSPSPRKVKAVLMANGISTPRELIRALGTDKPSYGEWLKFIQRINERAEKNVRLGESCAQDMRNWMRRKHYMAGFFRGELPK